MKSKLLRMLVFFAAIVPLHTAFFNVRPIEKAPADLLLCADQSPEENPAYSKILKAEDEPGRERAKIDYLISRIRCSHYLFIRNGSVHAAPQAAQHLMWKYHRKHDRIKTAGDFITYLASGSSLTGQPYLLKFPSGKTYPVQDILRNELTVLEAHLEKPSESYTEPRAA